MNPIKKDGLSARRKTINSRKPLVNLLPSLGAFFLMVVTFSSCHQNTKGQSSADLQNHPNTQDSVNKPKVNIQVNRRYDDKGNLIGFDSLYSTYYSSSQGDSANTDSLMKDFDKYFQKQHPSFFDNRMNTLFFSDSLHYPDFFHNDFFMKHYELNDAYFRNMMHQMDSIKNSFYKSRSLNKKQKQS
jgi:hypothetical protein